MFTVRVSNVPRELSSGDIEEAFSQSGKVRKCRSTGAGSFSVVFENEKDASDAIYRYDGGSLNGSKIRVEMQR